MEIPKILQELLDKKAEMSNTVDLDAYANGLLDMYQALQLQQTGVIKSVCEIEKEFEGCPLFKQYDNGCYGCKYRKQTVL